MIRLLIRLAVFLTSAALGLLGAALVLPSFQLSVSGFATAIVVFAVIKAILTPLLSKLTRRYVSALTSGVGLIATLLALIVASLFPDGLHATGIVTWALASLIVWFITSLADWFLPKAFLRDPAKQRDQSR